MLAVETILKTVLRHMVPVAFPSAESVWELISGTAASYLSTVPVRFPSCQPTVFTKTSARQPATDPPGRCGSAFGIHRK